MLDVRTSLRGDTSLRTSSTYGSSSWVEIVRMAAHPSQLDMRRSFDRPLSPAQQLEPVEEPACWMRWQPVRRATAGDPADGAATQSAAAPSSCLSEVGS